MKIRKADPRDLGDILRINNGVEAASPESWALTASELERSFEGLRDVYLVADEGDEVLAYMWGRWITQPWSQPHVTPDEDFHMIQFAAVPSRSGQELVRAFAGAARELVTGSLTVGFNMAEGGPLHDVLVELGCVITPTDTFYENGARRHHGVWHL